MSNHLTTDVIVVGAGLVGLSAAITLALLHKKVVLVDSHPSHNNNSKLQPDWDTRLYALTPASISWLECIGVWSYVDKSRLGAINQMHLWANDHVEQLILKDSDAHLTQLGLIVENKNLLQALRQRIKTLDVTIIENQSGASLDYLQPHKITLTLNNATIISANLLVAADGVHSWVRSQTNIGVTIKPFNQTAIVANFTGEILHQNIAYQWFKSHDTLALLPLPDRMVSMVWSVSNAKAVKLLSLTPEDLAQAVLKQSRGILGRLSLLGTPHSFMLNQQTANHLIADRIMFIGDAAHQIHPLAGQGVNLGFRDVMQMQQLMTNAHTMQDIGEHIFLRRYERNRRADIASINTLTSGLDWLFSSEHNVVNASINWGFKQLNKQLKVKKLLIQAATA